MKKLIILLFTIGIWIGALAQTYTSKSLEVMDYTTTKTLRVATIDFNFVLDTAGRVLTALDLQTGNTQFFSLVRRSSVVMKSSQFRTWGYEEVKTIGIIKYVSFTETLDGKLLSINFYDDTKIVIIFYIEQKKNV